MYMVDALIVNVRDIGMPLGGWMASATVLEVELRQMEAVIWLAKS